MHISERARVEIAFYDLNYVRSLRLATLNHTNLGITERFLHVERKSKFVFQHLAPI